MGCLCSKGAKHDADPTSENRTPPRKKPAAAARAKTASSTNVGSTAVGDVRGRVVAALDVRISSDNNVELKGLSGENEVDGWPAWLVNVAPKAVEGWLPRRADSFEKLDKIGQGTYSIVYKARDLETGKIVALKKVRFVNMDTENVRFMAREIHILRRLDHPNVIKLEGIVTSRMSQSLYLVFEYMEHDLSGLIATPDLKLTEPQLLHGLDHCHKKGVLHRDIKGSNLLIDSNGTLKIADFGLAISFDPSNPRPLTSRVVTLWYRPPELLLGATEYGVAVDMWSTGCIVAELFAGKPIMPGRTEVEQIHKIFKLCGSPMDDYCMKLKVPETAMSRPQQQYRRCVAETFQVFPPSAVVLIDSLLSLEPEVRGTASSALQSDFFRTEPLACETSSLPKLPPSKEYDVRLRQEEARRQRKAALGGRGAETVKPGNESRVTGRNGTAKPKALSTTVQVPGWGSGYTDHPTMPGRAVTSVPLARAPSRSHIPQLVGTDFSDGYEATGKDQPLDRPASSHRNNPEEKDISNHGRKYRRIHHSGPLMPPGGNIDDMLKDHERHIQEAVRKSCLAKASKEEIVTDFCE